MKYNTIYNDPHQRTKITYPWVYWDNAFTEEELQSIESYCDGFETEYATTMGTQDKTEIEKIRISDVKFFSRQLDTAWIFDRINFVITCVNEQFYGFELNGYDSFQYTKYTSDKRGNYGWHMDMALGDATPVDMLEPRKLSFSLLLNDDFEGGEFEMNEGQENTPTFLPTQKGRFICFPSFMIHRVKPVTKGTRKSIVVWVTGPKFV